MYFKGTLALFVCLFISLQAKANSKGILQILHAAPSKCIALNQGRTCYATIIFTITTPEAGTYCIKESEAEIPLQCWSKTNKIEHILHFGSKQSVSYELISKDTLDVLAVTTIDVNWVHKIKNKKRRWRLF